MTGRFRRPSFEQLEVRQYFSNVDITDFGARANDGKDDSGAIRAAIRASKAGDTIYFSAGTFNIDSFISLRGDREYRSEEGAILKGSSDHHIFKINEDDVRVEGLTFDGKPIFIDKLGGQMVEGLVINENTFHINATGEADNGITFTTGLRKSYITNNTFDHMDADNGIYGYNWDRLTIANNSFVNGNEGIHVVAHKDDSADLLIEQNYFASLRRMGIELQGGGHDTIVQDNYYEKPSMSSNKDLNGSTFAYSIIADRSVGTIVRRNTSIAPERPDGKGVRIVIEIGGDNTLVEENYSVGANHVLAANDGVGTTSVLAKNNLFKDYLKGPEGRGLTLQNNGPSTKLSWNIDRGKPGPNVRLGLNGVISKEDAPTDVPSEVPAPEAPAPTPAAFEYLSDMKMQVANSSWGPVEIDKNNGGINANDGTRMRLDNKNYLKGVGVAGDSELVYSLDGNYSKFFTDIGVDEVAGPRGSVTFQIWLDGTKVYDSGLMTGETPRKGLTLNVSGAKSLKLITTDAGDGERGDHANWAGARLLPAV